MQQSDCTHSSGNDEPLRLVRSIFEPSTRENIWMRVLVLWAVGRRCSVPQVFAKPGKSREIRERAGYYVRHLGVANAVFFCACSTKSWKTRDLLRSCLREATGADLLQCKGKEPDQFAKWFCTVRCVPSLAAAGERPEEVARQDRMGAVGATVAISNAPHPNPPPLSQGRETESYVPLSPLPDRCIQPIPTRKNGAAPDSPPASCVLRGRRVRSPW